MQLIIGNTELSGVEWANTQGYDEVSTWSAFANLMFKRHRSEIDRIVAESDFGDTHNLLGQQHKAMCEYLVLHKLLETYKDKIGVLVTRHDINPDMPLTPVSDRQYHLFERVVAENPEKPGEFNLVSQ